MDVNMNQYAFLLFEIISASNEYLNEISNDEALILHPLNMH